MFLRISCKKTVASEPIEDNNNTQKDGEKDDETSVSAEIPVTPGAS